MPTPAGRYNSGVWSAEEHEAYLLAVKDFTSWKDVAGRVGTRSITQCRSHDQKLKKKEVNRKEGRGRASRMEHRLLSDEAKQATPPSSPTGVDGRVVPSIPVDVNLGGLDVKMGDLGVWGSSSSSIPTTTQEEDSLVLDPLVLDDIGDDFSSLLYGLFPAVPILDWSVPDELGLIDSA